MRNGLGVIQISLFANASYSREQMWKLSWEKLQIRSMSMDPDILSNFARCPSFMKIPISISMVRALRPLEYPKKEEISRCAPSLRNKKTK